MVVSVVQELLEDLVNYIDYDTYKSLKCIDEDGNGDEFPDLVRQFVEV